MEDNNTQSKEPTCGTCGNELTLVRPGKHQCDYCESKVEGEKPDFFDAAKKYATNVSADPDEETPDWIITDFEAGANHVWDTYVTPLQARIKELEQEKLELVKNEMRLIHSHSNVLEEWQQECAGLRFKIKELESSQSWVSVKERYPEAGQLVFVHLSDGSRLTGRVWGNGSWSAFFVDGESTLTERRVTFWQPLPSKPENK